MSLHENPKDCPTWYDWCNCFEIVKPELQKFCEWLLTQHIVITAQEVGKIQLEKGHLFDLLKRYIRKKEVE